MCVQCVFLYLHTCISNMCFHVIFLSANMSLCCSVPAVTLCRYESTNTSIANITISYIPWAQAAHHCLVLRVRMTSISILKSYRLSNCVTVRAFACYIKINLVCGIQNHLHKNHQWRHFQMKCWTANIKKWGKTWREDDREDAARLVRMDFHRLSACYACGIYQGKYV